MEPSDLYTARFPGPDRLKLFDLPTYAVKVIETLTLLHHVKMWTDEPTIAERCQELINLLILKYPNLVPHIDNSFTKDSDG